MSQVVMAALLAALATSALTWAIAYGFYRARLSQQLAQLRDELAGEVEERVRRGAMAAGQELMPDFRKEVAAGFRDALEGAARGDIARSVARQGAEFVGDSLESLFGPRKR